MAGKKDTPAKIDKDTLEQLGLSFMWPVPNTPGQFWQQISNTLRGGRRYHKGIDIQIPEDNIPAFASEKGTITNSGEFGAYGNRVVIDHTPEKKDIKIYSVYGHLRYNEDSKYKLVNAGKRIEKGEPVGTVGNTGGSNGQHLHFEFRASLNKSIDDISDTYEVLDILGANEIVRDFLKEKGIHAWKIQVTPSIKRILVSFPPSFSKNEQPFISSNMKKDIFGVSELAYMGFPKYQYCYNINDNGKEVFTKNTLTEKKYDDLINLGYKRINENSGEDITFLQISSMQFDYFKGNRGFFKIIPGPPGLMDNTGFQGSIKHILFENREGQREIFIDGSLLSGGKYNLPLFIVEDARAKTINLKKNYYDVFDSNVSVCRVKNLISFNILSDVLGFPITQSETNISDNPEDVNNFTLSSTTNDSLTVMINIRDKSAEINYNGVSYKTFNKYLEWFYDIIMPYRQPYDGYHGEAIKHELGADKNYKQKRKLLSDIALLFGLETSDLFINNSLTLKGIEDSAQPGGKGDLLIDKTLTKPKFISKNYLDIKSDKFKVFFWISVDSLVRLSLPKSDMINILNDVRNEIKNEKIYSSNFKTEAQKLINAFYIPLPLMGRKGYKIIDNKNGIFTIIKNSLSQQSTRSLNSNNTLSHGININQILSLDINNTILNIVNPKNSKNHEIQFIKKGFMKTGESNPSRSNFTSLPSLFKSVNRDQDNNKGVIRESVVGATVKTAGKNKGITPLGKDKYNKMPEPAKPKTTNADSGPKPSNLLGDKNKPGANSWQNMAKGIFGNLASGAGKGNLPSAKGASPQQGTGALAKGNAASQPYPALAGMKNAWMPPKPTGAGIQAPIMPNSAMPAQKSNGFMRPSAPPIAAPNLASTSYKPQLPKTNYIPESTSKGSIGKDKKKPDSQPGKPKVTDIAIRGENADRYELMARELPSMWERYEKESAQRLI